VPCMGHILSVVSIGLIQSMLRIYKKLLYSCSNSLLLFTSASCFAQLTLLEGSRFCIAPVQSNSQTHIKRYHFFVPAMGPHLLVPTIRRQTDQTHACRRRLRPTRERPCVDDEDPASPVALEKTVTAESLDE